MSTLGVAIIGCGGIALQNHLPGLAICPDTKVVALCDANAAVLAQAQSQTGLAAASTDYREIVGRDDVQAVIIATPNVTHAPIALAAIAHGKHVLCEKPIAMSAAEARSMAAAADKAGVRHMTAYTYRFVPAMRYLAHLVKRGDLGVPYHFRSCRLQDWGARDIGWRQEKKLAGSGELGDMLSHRVDFAHLLYGDFNRIVAGMKRFIDDRHGHASDLEDWVTIMADFDNGATGVLESSKLATGHNESWRSLDHVEMNGSEASFVFSTGKWNEIHIGKPGGAGLEKMIIPKEFFVWPGSPRDAAAGNPLITFRYDQNYEFIEAIRDQRPCRPSFHDGYRSQTVMDAAYESTATGQWVNLKY